MVEKKTGFIQSLVTAFLEANHWFGAVDVYTKAGISKQNFHNTMRDGKTGREVTASSWAAFRKAIKMSKKDFWKKAQDHFDP